jgi:hypothetical protein
MKNFIKISHLLTQRGLSRKDVLAMPFWELFQRMELFKEQNEK